MLKRTRATVKLNVQRVPHSLPYSSGFYYKQTKTFILNCGHLRQADAIRAVKRTAETTATRCALLEYPNGAQYIYEYKEKPPIACKGRGLVETINRWPARGCRCEYCVELRAEISHG